MRFGYVMSTDKGATDRLLSDVAQRLIDAGLRPAGVVQTNTPRPSSHRCDMDVTVLPDGPVIRISQNLGPEARGCALDPDALERAVAATTVRIGTAQALIVNKFGKHEADGRGFRDLIGEAGAMGLPVLVGLNPMNETAFTEFSGGIAERLAADADTLAAWIVSAVGEELANRAGEQTAGATCASA